MEKVLFITAFTPSNLGAAVKNTKIMLSDISSKYNIDLVYFKNKSDEEYTPDNSRINVIHVEHYSFWRKIKGVISFPFVHPFFNVRFSWKMFFTIKKAIKKGNYKVVIFDHSQVQLFARLLNEPTAKYLICHDIISQRVERSSNILLSRLAFYSERYVLNSINARIFSFSQKDCNLVNNLFSKNATLCLDYIDINAENAYPTQIEDYFVFFAYWGRPDNFEGLQWFYTKVVPLIKTQTRIIIIGKGLNEKLVKNNNPLVKTEIMGFVDNPYNIIANSKALISPLFSGAGIKVKVIEAFACGAPVLGSDLAFEGFDSQYNSFMKRCYTPDDYINNMECINYTKEERIQFKRVFIDSYKSKTMLGFIDELKD